jgi:hypothetical protein
VQHKIYRFGEHEIGEQAVNEIRMEKVVFLLCGIAENKFTGKREIDAKEKIKPYTLFFQLFSDNRVYD